MPNKTLYEILKLSGLPCAYSHFKDDDGELPFAPPYIVYIGSGQNDLAADNTYIWTRNQYQIEYYFTKKDEAKESLIEKLLLQYGYNYTKSEDVYIQEENVFVIYYNV